ncbi:MAG: PLP-dependent aminotransferase family protein [Desertifilum sp. SIO1I2]|nr:PLP-dependent aminotransferase family protein [Desertifilum sp. SIO1I2]
MRIPLDRRSHKAVYLQIRDRISRLIESGALKPGDKLPSIRSLAEGTNVNKLTVLEAYSVLEAEGLVHARQGSGYFVSTPPLPLNQTQSTFAPPQEAIVTEQQGGWFYNLYMASLSAKEYPDIIDFSNGFSQVCEAKDLPRVARRAVKQVGDVLFNYDLPQGLLALRQQIARLLIQRGLEVTPDNLIVTNGSKQALSLAIHYYVKPGDWAIVECPCYHGVLAILSELGVRAIGIPMTPEGMNLELLEQYLHTHRPKLIYTVSTLHNPTGITTSQAHRQQLVRLAERYGCPILEDNAYEGLNFDPVPAPIKALDKSHIVTYLGTFSKTLMPGIRVGYMVSTGQHYQPLLERKLLHDLHVSTVSQAIVSEYLASGNYRRHLAHLQTKHLERRNMMLSALERYFPSQVAWTLPNGGTFIWVQLPPGAPMPEICQEALAQKILVAEGKPFFPDFQGYPAMRLNFSLTPEAIETGVSTLGSILKRYI